MIGKMEVRLVLKSKNALRFTPVASASVLKALSEVGYTARRIRQKDSTYKIEVKNCYAPRLGNLQNAFVSYVHW